MQNKAVTKALGELTVPSSSASWDHFSSTSAQRSGGQIRFACSRLMLGAEAAVPMAVSRGCLRSRAQGRARAAYLWGSSTAGRPLVATPAAAARALSRAGTTTTVLTGSLSRKCTLPTLRPNELLWQELAAGFGRV